MRESEFHRAIGGNKRIDRRFVNENYAAQIRKLLFELRLSYGWFYKDIAKLLGTSVSTLSMAAGGRAGTKIDKEGQSTTQRILDGLIDLSSKNE